MTFEVVPLKTQTIIRSRFFHFWKKLKRNDSFWNRLGSTNLKILKSFLIKVQTFNTAISEKWNQKLCFSKAFSIFNTIFWKILQPLKKAQNFFLISRSIFNKFLNIKALTNIGKKLLFLIFSRHPFLKFLSSFYEICFQRFCNFINFSSQNHNHCSLKGNRVTDNVERKKLACWIGDVCGHKFISNYFCNIAVTEQQKNDKL